MSPARYAPLPNPRAADDADREMDDAFDDDGSDHEETTPLNVDHHYAPEYSRESAPAPAGAYDFERDYDYPPPGSPPRPSSIALPNDHGNSNGLVPSSPVVRGFIPPRPSFFRRTVSALLPSHYRRVPTRAQAPGHGSGAQNDGVFANVMAKPTAPVTMQTDDGQIYMVPEETQAEAPPSYAAASADAAPAYWETTVHAPGPALNLSGDLVIDELPTGPFVNFLFTALISWFFQFPGFLLTYLLHGTHAGRFGSQAGLALTLIQFGFGSTVTRGFSDDSNVIFVPGGEGESGSSEPPPMDNVPAATDMPLYSTSHEWVSFLLMTIGWFLLLTSIIGYVRVKRFEMSIRAAQRQASSPFSTNDVQRDAALRRNLEEVFGISITAVSTEAEPEAPPPPPPRPRNAREAQLMAEEARLENDLRAAGLL